MTEILFSVSPSVFSWSMLGRGVFDPPYAEHIQRVYQWLLSYWQVWWTFCGKCRTGGPREGTCHLPLVQWKRSVSRKACSLYSQAIMKYVLALWCLLLMNKQFCQSADAFIVSTSIASNLQHFHRQLTVAWCFFVASDLRNRLSWISCNVFVSQSPWKTDVAPTKRTAILTLHKCS